MLKSGDFGLGSQLFDRSDPRFIALYKTVRLPNQVFGIGLGGLKAQKKMAELFGGGAEGLKKIASHGGDNLQQCFE